ncbi:hypothetical protein PLICRDRAFT_36945 [Plicaturopsis crispa FD-325 SS-3]|nr:hypothetical protein PLICRDRAFT_36945 [Plicaturopsis crispa FD-325 SS-3]
MAAAAKIPVIIDTDPGVDDVIAILLALASPELEILGFVVSFGNTDLESSRINIFKTYQALTRHIERHPEDRGRFPNLFSETKPFVAKGAVGPLDGDLHSAEYFHGRDGLGDITGRHPDLDYEIKDGTPFHPQLNPTDRPAVDMTLEVLRARPARSVTYIALGPLTNLATALRKDAATVRDRIGRVSCMGGALDVPGNTSPVSEFNFFADPYAVREVLTPDDPNTGIPLDRFLLLPLDITTPHQLRFPLYKEVVDPALESTEGPSVAHGKAVLTHFTSAFLERTREVMVQFGNDAMELHDIVAVWCAIMNPPVLGEEGGSPRLEKGWKAMKRKFQVERTGEITRGMLVVDRREDESAYAPGSNRAEAQEALERQMTKHRAFESTALPAEVANGQPIKVRDGVACIVETPGSDVLVKLLFERIWGAV